MQPQHHPLLAFHLFLVVCVHHHHERRAVGAGRRFDHVRDESLVRRHVQILELLSREFLVAREVEVRAVVDPFEFLPPEGKIVLNVVGVLRVVRQLLFRVLVKPQLLGVHAQKLRFHQHTKEELAHYAKDAYDIQYDFPFGWQEFEGIHNRTNFDLSRHQEFSGKKLEYLDVATNERFIPYVVETSAGADRTTLVVMVNAYHEEEVEGEKPGGLPLHPPLAPLKAAVFPLVNKDGMPELARRIFDDLRKHYNTFYDDGGVHRRRLRRPDGARTPLS